MGSCASDMNSDQNAREIIRNVYKSVKGETDSTNTAIGTATDSDLSTETCTAPEMGLCASGMDSVKQPHEVLPDKEKHLPYSKQETNQTTPSTLRQNTGVDCTISTNEICLSFDQQTSEGSGRLQYMYMDCDELINIFEDLIVENLQVLDILPHLPFLEHHDDICEIMKKHSEKEAIKKLLDELSKSTEIGKWQKFIDVLYAKEYTYIVDNIQGYIFLYHKFQKEYIKQNTPTMVKLIAIRELLPHLLAHGLVSEYDKEVIERELENRGNIAAVMEFLGRVPKKHRYWYPLMIKALENAKMDEVATILKKPKYFLTTSAGRRKVPTIGNDTIHFCEQVQRDVDCNNFATFGTDVGILYPFNEDDHPFCQTVC